MRFYVTLPASILALKHAVNTSSIRFALYVILHRSNLLPIINARIILRRCQDVQTLPFALVVRSFQRYPEGNRVNKLK